MKFNPAKTALLTLDLQKGIFDFNPAAETILPNAAKAAEIARKNQFSIIHVGLGFEPGHPEIGTRPANFVQIKERGLFVKGSESTVFHPAVFKTGETIIYKQRYCAFSENSLAMVLRAKGIEHLVFFGISTSGIVLSTLRRAFDLDFQCTVIKDACFDPDEEVHRVLTEKIFTKQATVLTVDALAAEAASA